MEELDKKYQDNGFKVPEHYFEDFDHKVLERLREMQEKPKPGLRVWKKQAWLVAASMALISAIAYIAYQTAPVTNQEQLSFDNLDPEELIAYENEIELSEDEFEDIIPAYTIDSLYNAEILPVSYEFNEQDLQDIEEEYSALDEEIEI